MKSQCLLPGGNSHINRTGCSSYSVLEVINAVLELLTVFSLQRATAGALRYLLRVRRRKEVLGLMPESGGTFQPTFTKQDVNTS